MPRGIFEWSIITVSLGVVGALFYGAVFTEVDYCNNHQTGKQHVACLGIPNMPIETCMARLKETTLLCAKKDN